MQLQTNKNTEAATDKQQHGSSFRQTATGKQLQKTTAGKQLQTNNNREAASDKQQTETCNIKNGIPNQDWQYAASPVYLNALSMDFTSGCTDYYSKVYLWIYS